MIIRQPKARLRPEEDSHESGGPRMSSLGGLCPDLCPRLQTLIRIAVTPINSNFGSLQGYNVTSRRLYGENESYRPSEGAWRRPDSVSCRIVGPRPDGRAECHCESARESRRTAHCRKLCHPPPSDSWRIRNAGCTQPPRDFQGWRARPLSGWKLFEHRLHGS